MKKIVIDVSEHQGVIDWAAVKGQIDGAILRCGYGDDIASQDDGQWKRNADECTRLGIPFGAYIYSYATSMAQAESEAQYALRCVNGYKLSYPIYLDLEQPGTEAGAVERARKFGGIIESKGYWCGMYANLNWWSNYLVGLDQFTKWVAQYNTSLDYKGSNVDMWQYTSTGSVSGIAGNVDMNECYRDFPSEINGGNSNGGTQPVTRKNVHLYEFNGGLNQQWELKKEKDGYAKLTCRGNNLCLDVDGAGKKNGTNVQVYISNDSAAQRFLEKEIKKPDTSTCVELIPKHAPDMRLDCAAGGLGNKTNVQLYKANNSAAQQWYKRVLADGYIVYINVNSGRVLDGGGAIK